MMLLHTILAHMTLACLMKDSDFEALFGIGKDKYRKTAKFQRCAKLAPIDWP